MHPRFAESTLRSKNPEGVVTLEGSLTRKVPTALEFSTRIRYRGPIGRRGIEGRGLYL